MNIYTRESQIRDLFSKFGQIRRINMITCSQVRFYINANDKTSRISIKFKAQNPALNLFSSGRANTPHLSLGCKF